MSLVVQIFNSHDELEDEVSFWDFEITPGEFFWPHADPGAQEPDDYDLKARELNALFDDHRRLTCQCNELCRLNPPFAAKYRSDLARLINDLELTIYRMNLRDVKLKPSVVEAAA